MLKRFWRHKQNPRKVLTVEQDAVATTLSAEIEGFMLDSQLQAALTAEGADERAETLACQKARQGSAPFKRD